MKQWPENDKPADFSDLVKAVYEAIRFAYSFERKNEGVDIPFIGPDAPPTVFNPSGSECLQIKWLGASPEDQIHTPIEIIIGVAIRLGAEQERRASKQKRNEYLNSASLSLESLKRSIDSYRSGQMESSKFIDYFLNHIERDISKLAS